MPKPFTRDKNHSLVTKKVHSWLNRPPVTKPFTHNCSPVNNYNIIIIPEASIIVALSVLLLYDCDTFLCLSKNLTLPGAPLWLWNFFGPLYDCETSWSLFMIVILPVPLYDCDTSCASLWLQHSLSLYDCVTLHDCETSSSIAYCFDIKFYSWRKVNWFSRIRGNVILLIFYRICIE